MPDTIRNQWTLSIGNNFSSLHIQLAPGIIINVETSISQSVLLSSVCSDPVTKITEAKIDFWVVTSKQLEMRMKCLWSMLRISNNSLCYYCKFDGK
jgi:hypothetical protein